MSPRRAKPAAAATPAPKPRHGPNRYFAAPASRQLVEELPLLEELQVRDRARAATAERLKLSVQHETWLCTVCRDWTRDGSHRTGSCSRCGTSRP